MFYRLRPHFLFQLVGEIATDKNALWKLTSRGRFHMGLTGLMDHAMPR